ncbi:hypothetical protein M4578_09880, partial [Salipiger sp. P9]|uniref:TadE/TadG family type IV pilus assembly protein n=1 Tax=Salipiger pentaromativorans TaxID=2943193 RepID=UPI002157E69A
MIKRHLRRFSSDTEGYVSVEVMIMLPVLFLLFGASWVYFDVFRQQAINQKANYTIGDMISRETDPIDGIYIDNTFKLLGMLTKNPVEIDELTGTYSADMRITVVRYNGKNDKYQVVWSVARGDLEPLANNVMRNYIDRLPVMVDNAQVVLVETAEDYNPIFSVGLDAFQIQTYSFTHPRYAPQVLWDDTSGNNGWGNGDQDAPGGSLCNNNAENATECTNEDGSQNVEPN